MIDGDAPLSEAAHRISDAHNEVLAHMGVAACGRWLAFRLSDGRHDGVLYDTRADAIRHQLHETQCVYIAVQPTGLQPRGAEIFMRNMREFYDSGRRFLHQIDLDPSYQGR